MRKKLYGDLILYKEKRNLFFLQAIQVAGWARENGMLRLGASLTYDEAMERFGHDAPDLRFGAEIVDLSDLAPQSEFGVFNFECFFVVNNPQPSHSNHDQDQKG